jgi:peptidoglycan/xylan/chitin deacetylase (PgdA/CDA1 family)
VTAARLLVTFGIALALIGSTHSRAVAASRAGESDVAAVPVVSLAFDDSSTTQMPAEQLLASHQMHGVFYVNTGSVGVRGRMSWADIRALAADGNEIGGHTLDHPHLDTLSAAEVNRQICADRANLLAEGLMPYGFAYPYGIPGDYGDQAVRDCGYSYARLVGGYHARGLCDGCFPAQPLGPEDPYRLWSWVPDGGVSLSQLQDEVRRAEGSQGLLLIVFHGLCTTSCTGEATGLGTLASFLDWLDAERASGRVAVDPPAVALGLTIDSPLGPNLLPNPSLSAAGTSVPCWAFSNWGNGSVSWHPRNSGAGGVWLSIAPGDSTSAASLSIARTRTCTPAARHAPMLATVSYRGSATLRLEVDIEEHGAWRKWISSAHIPTSASWTSADLRVPLLPALASRIAFAVRIEGPGWAELRTASLSTVGVSSRVPQLVTVHEFGHVARPIRVLDRRCTRREACRLR